MSEHAMSKDALKKTVRPGPRANTGRVRAPGPFVVLASFLFSLSAPAMSAQEDEHDHSAHIERVAPGPGDPELEAELYGKLARPVVEAYREEFETVQDPRALRTPLRALAGQIYDTVAERLKDDVKNRAPVARHVREKFLAEIEKIASTPAAAAALHELMDEAVQADVDARREHLWSTIMCWCPKENFTRTLSGCPDGCAEEQKAMVTAGIDEGRTADEIVELMVADPRGGERVRGYLKATGVNRLGYLLPFLFLGAAAIVVGFVLYGLTRRREGEAPPAPASAGHSSTEDLSEDEHWGDVVERELKEMDS